MTIPMLAGTYPNGLLLMIQAVATYYFDRNTIDRAPLNVIIPTWKPSVDVKG